MKKKIMDWKLNLNDAYLIHYNMDTEAVQHFCGGRWMNKHRRNLKVLQVMSHIMPTDRFLALGAGLVDGVSNFLYSYVLLLELKANISTPNLPSVTRNPELIDKAIRKEEKNILSLCHNNVATTFIPDLGIIKLGVVDKQGKKL